MALKKRNNISTKSTFLLLNIVVVLIFTFLNLHRISSSGSNNIVNTAPSDVPYANKQTDDTPVSNIISSKNNSAQVSNTITSSGSNIIIGSKDDIVKCNDDGEECRGFFHYSPPNHSPNATQLLHETANAYSYGLEKNNDGHLIFFPNHTKSEECIVEWGNARSGI